MDAIVKLDGYRRRVHVVVSFLQACVIARIAPQPGNDFEEVPHSLWYRMYDNDKSVTMKSNDRQRLRTPSSLW